MASISDDKINPYRQTFYKVNRKIATGGFAVVHEVEVKTNFSNGKSNFREGMKLAMKRSYRGINNISVIEIDILNRVNHINVVNSYDTFSDRRCSVIFLILPLALFDLSDLIKDKEINSSKYNPDTILDLSYQLICGLNYLHSNNIIHDDIKPGNVLIYQDDDNDRFIAKIGDYGLSSDIFTTEKIDTVSQTLWWRPPEILKGENGENEPHLYESDIWAMGAVLLELITGKSINKFVPQIENTNMDITDRLLILHTSSSIQWSILFLSFDIFDRYIAKMSQLGKSVGRDKYHLIINISMYLVVRLQHIDDITVNDFIEVNDSISVEEYTLSNPTFIRTMCKVLETIDWKILYECVKRC